MLEGKNDSGGISRRGFLKMLGGIAAAAAVPESTKAQTDTERKITISPEAGSAMERWGITFNGSQIAGGEEFQHSTRNTNFRGICLTQEAIRVDIESSPPPNEALYFVIENKDGSKETAVFTDLGAEGKKYRVMGASDPPIGYREGLCEVGVS